MPGTVEHRSATWLIQTLRNIGRGRKVVLPQRYADEQAERTQPPPDVPGGPYHKTSEIYYYTHDARREVKPPLVISTAKQISTKSKLSAKTFTTPGKIYKWD